MAKSSLPEIVSESDALAQSYNIRFLADMSEIHAKAITDAAKYTYAVPARHETYRFCGVLVLVAVLLFFFVPAFLSSNPDSKTLALLIGVIVTLVAGPSAIKAIVGTLKGSF